MEFCFKLKSNINWIKWCLDKTVLENYVLLYNYLYIYVFLFLYLKMSFQPHKWNMQKQYLNTKSTSQLFTSIQRDYLNSLTFFFPIIIFPDFSQFLNIFIVFCHIWYASDSSLTAKWKKNFFTLWISSYFIEQYTRFFQDCEIIIFQV